MGDDRDLIEGTLAGLTWEEFWKCADDAFFGKRETNLEQSVLIHACRTVLLWHFGADAINRPIEESESGNTTAAFLAFAEILVKLGDLDDLVTTNGLRAVPLGELEGALEGRIN